MKRFFAIVLIFSVICITVYPYGISIANAEQIQLNIADGFELYAENKEYSLYLNETDLNFAVYRKADGFCQYAYAGSDTLATNTENLKENSLVLLSYQSASGVSAEMNSAKDCVQKEQFKIKKIKNGFQINMAFGDRPDARNVPVVLTAKRMEQVLSSLSNDQKAIDRLSYIYKFKSIKTCTSDEKKQFLKRYSGFEKYDIYVAKNLNRREITELSEYFSKAGFNAEDLKKEYKLLKYVPEEEISAYFEMQFKCTLNSKGVSVLIPSKEIKYDNNNFYLSNIRLLPFFGALAENDGGYLFYPDGCGRLIYANGIKKSVSQITGRIYGRDLAIDSDDSNTIALPIPIYAVCGTNGGFLTEIKSGAAEGYLTTETAGHFHSFYTVYPTFIYLNKMELEGSGTDESYSLFEKQCAMPDLELSITILSGDTTPSELANITREKLLGKRIPNKTNEDIPLFLTTLGALNDTVDLLGIKWEKSIPLTTFEENEKIIKNLNEQGVGKISLQLEGIANGGLNNFAYSDLDLIGCIGGKKGLIALEKYCNKHNVLLFPSVNLTTVSRTKIFDGFNARNDSNRSIDGNTVERQLYDFVAGAETKNNVVLTLSAKTALSYSKKLVKDFKKLKIDKLSLGELGSVVSSDFRKKNSESRDEMVNYYKKILSSYSGKCRVEGGNAYVFPYAKECTILPSRASSIENTGIEFPFLQMVLHGYIDYSISKFNLASDFNDTVLESIALGAVPDYTVAMQNIDRIREDGVNSKYYSVSFDYWLKRIVSSYSEINRCLSKVSGKRMTAYKTFEDGITCTFYENGVRVYVNRTSNDYSTDNIIINANSAFIEEGNDID